MTRLRLTSCALSLGLLALGTARTPARAISALTGTYFKIPVSHPDVQKGIDGGVITGLIASTLGPDGLPVVGAPYGGPSGPITDVNGFGEILWWSAASPNGVLLEKTQIDPLNFNFPTNFFPDGEIDNSHFFRAVHWNGAFNLATPGSINLGLGADDDAFVFIDGQLKVDNGGVKGLTSVPNVISGLGAGNHTLDLFFADRHTVQSGIVFTSEVTLTPSSVPEPGMTAFLGVTALSGAAFALRRRKR